MQESFGGGCYIVTEELSHPLVNCFAALALNPASNSSPVRNVKVQDTG